MNKLINIRKMFLTFSLIGLLAMSCAPSANSVMASSVSPILYQNLECDMLVMELASAEAKVAQLTKIQNKSKRFGYCCYGDWCFITLASTIWHKWCYG